MEYKSLNKKSINCMRVNAIIATVIFLIISIAAVAIILSNDVAIPTIAYICIAIFFVLLIIYDIVAPIIRYKRYSYYIDDEMFVVVEGLWFITKSIAPIERIHQIAVNRGPVDRMFGLAKVSIITAGGQITLSFLETDIAEEIADKLNSRINHIVKEQGVDIIE